MHLIAHIKNASDENMENELIVTIIFQKYRDKRHNSEKKIEQFVKMY